MRKICKPLGIEVDERWVDGFLVTASEEKTIYTQLRPLGFEVQGIGVGYDYNRKVVTLYAYRK